MTEKTKTQADAGRNGSRLPLLSKTAQKVLAALVSLKQRKPGMVDLPTSTELQDEIIRLGFEAPALSTVVLELRKLKETPYITQEPFKVLPYASQSAEVTA